MQNAVVSPEPVRTSTNPKDTLRYYLDIENEAIRNYRDRIRQCQTQRKSIWPLPSAKKFQTSATVTRDARWAGVANPARIA